MLRCNMERLNNVSTPNEIKRQLKKLLMLKRSGELDTTEQLLMSNNEFWRDSVTYDCLERYLHHYDDEVKLNTLTLVIESKKSTLKFTSKELDTIILFLLVNFKEKIEYVPLIKKALMRMKESLAVMRRQCKQEEKMRNHYGKNHNPSEMKQEVLDISYKVSNDLKSHINVYRNFYQCLRKMCICSPDATYNRRKCCLKILLLMRDLLDDEFKDIAWEAEQVEALFDLMLLDTYESNKEMAFRLIKSLDITLLQLHSEETIRDIIMVAIELGNSIRPIDSITAVYMLKLSIMSPVVQNVLETQFSLARLDEDMTEKTVLRLILVLLNKLKASLSLAKQNIVKTVTKHSLYGYLYCIRSLLEDCDLKSTGTERLWQKTVAELINVCFEFSHAVSLIVNNSSPEGHLPMDLNLQTVNDICSSVPEKQVVTPQMVLLCSWRTIKEVSLLFGSLSTKAPICEESSSIGLLNEEQILKIGKHLVSLLTETKHRGAFEQAHVGFSQLCSRLWRLNKTSLNQLPKLWLHQTLIAITGIKENSKLCATRRSAGVPFMIQALLSTEPRQHKDTNSTTFDSVMKILLAIARLNEEDLWKNVKEILYLNSIFIELGGPLLSAKQNNDLSTIRNSTKITEIRTHALNILRAIFRHSQLGEVVNNYIENGIIAAFRNYDALTWAERNAATLLFSALIIRIFGVQRTKDHVNLTVENKMNYRLFFEKYPNLLPFILNELQTFVAMDDTLMKTNVQSILLLLSRLYHSHSSEPSNMQWQINDLVDLVIQCAKSVVFETRKLASRALVSLLTEQSVENVLRNLIQQTISSVGNHLSLNLMHGYMLQIDEILQYFGSKSFHTLSAYWNELFKRCIWVFDLEQGNARAPGFLLAAVFVNVYNKICQMDKIYLTQHSPMLHRMISHLLHTKLKQGPARELYKLSVIKFIQTIVNETLLIQQCATLRIYLHNLTIPETQIVAWCSLADIIHEVNDSDVSTTLLNYAVDEIQNSVQHLHRYNPELQDAIFNFLYNSILFYHQNATSDITTTVHICKLVLNEIRISNDDSGYYERDCYLRLLGKSYVTLVSIEKEEVINNLECANNVYSRFCDNLWIQSLYGNFRKSVFGIMQDLFLIFCKREEYHYVQVQWWTAVLQLLLDNNSDVRHEAYFLLDQIPVNCTMTRNFSYINMLLSKFYECNIHTKDPEFICAVFFYWSVALLDDIDYEMDDTDVFNKCTNYDFFEPVEVSRVCAEYLIKNMKSYIDNILTDNVIQWLNSVLNVKFQKCSFRTFVKDYQRHVPAPDNKLHNILNPTYKNKLLQGLAYKQYEIMF